MDRREEMAKIIKSKIELGWSKEHYYPNISANEMAKIVKYFDANMDTNSIIGFIDSSLTFNYKTGIVFTLQGIYYKEFLEDHYYLNYADIIRTQDLYFLNGKKVQNGYLEISLKNSKTLRINSSSFRAIKLKLVIDSLRELCVSESQVSTKSSGIIHKKAKMPDDIKKKCHAIIHSAAVSTGAVGTGMAQIPLADNAVITPIQIGMIISLGKVFGLRITEGVANGVIASCAATIAGRGITQVLWGWIPGLGNAINTATAAGLTEAVGWVAAKQFYLLQQDDAAKHRMAGMKAGYESASAEYEAKLRKQANEFISQICKVNEKFEEYNKLCEEYEHYIFELETKLEKTQQELNALNELKKQYEELVNLRNQQG